VTRCCQPRALSGNGGLGEPLRALSPQVLVGEDTTVASWRAKRSTGSSSVTLKLLAERWAALSAELGKLDAHLAPLLAAAAPRLLATHGVGPDTAATLLVAAGDNPDRLATEASFAALCGVSPVDASSGRQHRHRLNRGGNRDAHRALWVIVLVRMATDPRTRQYVTRRSAGLSKKDHPMPEAPRRSRDVPTAAPRRSPHCRPGHVLTDYRSIKLLRILNAMVRHQTSWSAPVPAGA
jgi:hypothetical protein